MMSSCTRRRSAWLSLTVLLVTTFILAFAATVQAQVLSDPRLAEFDPSPDHSVVLGSGDPAVLRYELSVYPLGSSVSVGTVDMGKPSPDADGKIRFDFSAQVAGWSLPGGDYEARVSAIGPQGAALSAPSNPFTFTNVPTCNFSLNATTVSVPASGGTYAVDVLTGTGCQWTVTAALPWVSVWTGGGSGSGTVPLEIQANSSSSSRTGTIDIAGQILTVSQGGAAQPCSYSLSPASASVPAAGGSASFAVTSSTGCSWTAGTSQSWIHVSGASGAGSGTVSLTADANSSTAARTGTVTVQGQTFTVSQAAAASNCSYTVSPTVFSFPSTGGGGEVTTTTNPGCAWSVTSSQSWLVPAAANGTGTATFGFTARTNNGMTNRTATLTVGPWAITVFQSGKPRRTK